MNTLIALCSVGKSHQRRAFQPALFSIIQGSGVGPAAFTVTAADLKPLHPDNSLVKFADDTYLVVPSVNANTRRQEVDNIATWATANDLKLNVLKSKKVIFQNSRRRTTVTPPQPLPNISRENVLKILGITILQTICLRQNISVGLSATAYNRCMRFD